MTIYCTAVCDDSLVRRSDARELRDIHGFQGTHQAAVWMGKGSQVVVIPGTGTIHSNFACHGMRFSHDEELTTSSLSLSIDAIK